MTSFNHRLGIFRGRLLRAAGMAALGAPLLYSSACTSEVIVVDDGDGGAGGVGTSGVTASSNSGVTVSVSSTSVGPTSTSVSGSGGGGSVSETCFSLIDGGCPAVDQAENYYGPCTYEGYFIEAWVTGPTIENGECCYGVVASEDFCGVGRPFMVEQGAAVAAVSVGDVGWLDDYETGGDGDLSVSERAVLAAMWTRDGLFEHASVASFARVSLELMALGAPAHLVEDAHAAAMDEIRHAKMCFALASRFEGSPVGVGLFRAATSSNPRSGLVELAVATLIEGCIGETIAASVAREQQLRATDGEVRRVLGQIADDETEHAELAWRTVAWALRIGGEPVRQALVAALRCAPEHLPALQGAEDRSLERFGRLYHADVAEMARRTLVEVVLPCAHALLAATGDNTVVRRQPQPLA